MVRRKCCKDVIEFFVCGNYHHGIKYCVYCGRKLDINEINKLAKKIRQIS